MPIESSRRPEVNKKFCWMEKIRKLLGEQGFIEVYTYTFRDKGDVELSNALASDKGWLRKNLREGVGASIDLNIKK